MGRRNDLTEAEKATIIKEMRRAKQPNQLLKE
jgi:hypothetical protein